jgi:ubiquinone/menaquinone biosynthesis C-methylase UbiE
MSLSVSAQSVTFRVIRGETEHEVTEQKAKEVFGERAAFYTTSPAHTDAQVLARVVELAGPHSNWSVLDIATGTGHTAFALSPHVASVIGIDLTPENAFEKPSF